MTIQRMSASRITYGCAGAFYDETGCHYAEGRSLADDHYAESRITVVDVSDPDVLAMVEALEKVRLSIAELEREQEHLRPVGVMSEKAFYRLENSECRFIALWPRPGIFLPRKRPEDGVIVYARTAAPQEVKP
ncbi:TPA: ead/Ea22-like family protein [Klebsiella variicola]